MRVRLGAWSAEKLCARGAIGGFCAAPLNFTVRSRAQMPRLTGIGCFALALWLGAAVHAQTQLDMNLDADRGLRDAESKLAAALAVYRERLNPSQQAAFDESQRRWVSYRKAACAFQASGVTGGSAHGMILALCLTDYAKQ